MPTAGLVGRARELAEVEARTTERRLVAIVGPGGVGKTVLARAAAERLTTSFPGGVRLVDLTRTDDPSGVPGTLSAQLGVDSFAAVLSSPCDRPALVVVDNCEHVIDAVASALAQVLGACPQTSVLATSRAPLELPGESIVVLAPLELPGPDADPRRSAAVELFLRRCHDAGGAVDDADLAVVAELCRRLDGLPLALEIAAARTRTLSVAEISSRLERGVDVLRRPRFRGDPRHRSVTDAIRWSVDLLSAEAAAALAATSVCVGPFTVVTARAVVDPEVDVDRALDELVAVSLVTSDTGGSETRYRLLDTVRRFGLGELDRRGATTETYGRFADHVVARSRALLADARSRWGPELLRDLVASFDDIAEALRWCTAHDDDPRRARQLCAPLWAVVHQGRADEVVELVRAVRDRFPEDASRGSAQAAAVLATAEYVTGDPATALRLAEAALAVHPQGDVPGFLLRRILGQARNALGDLDGAIEAFREGAELARRSGALAIADELVAARAQVTADAGRVDEALEQLDELLGRTDPEVSAIPASWARSTRAWIEARIDPSAALADAIDALDEARDLDYPVAVAVNLRTRAFAELLLGDPDAAARTLDELRSDLIRRGAVTNARILVDATAALAHRRDHPAWPVLAATARALPITTMASSHHELAPLPATTHRPVGRHEVIALVDRVLAELAASSPHPDEPRRPAEERRGRIVRRGDLVELVYDGRAVSVRASKGVVDLVRLIASDGAEVHCLDLADAAVEQRSTGELIDATARRRYEERIRELQDEIDGAELDNDYARAYRHQVELDQLVDHLSAAVGHGGRRRRASDTTERARSAVTHRIRGSIRQLERLHPALGRHLDRSIITGLRCRYRPEYPVTWEVVTG